MLILIPQVNSWGLSPETTTVHPILVSIYSINFVSYYRRDNRPQYPGGRAVNIHVREYGNVYVDMPYNEFLSWFNNQLNKVPSNLRIASGGN